jgi:hypothetical protein
VNDTQALADGDDLTAVVDIEADVIVVTVF